MNDMHVNVMLDLVVYELNSFIDLRVIVETFLLM